MERRVGGLCLFCNVWNLRWKDSVYSGDLNGWGWNALEASPWHLGTCLCGTGPSEHLPLGPPRAFGLPHMVTEFQERCPKSVSESHYSKGPDRGCLAFSDLVSGVM